MKIRSASSSVTSIHPFDVISSVTSLYNRISKRSPTHALDEMISCPEAPSQYPDNSTMRRHQSPCETWPGYWCVPWNTPIPRIILVPQPRFTATVKVGGWYRVVRTYSFFVRLRYMENPLREPISRDVGIVGTTSSA